MMMMSWRLFDCVHEREEFRGDGGGLLFLAEANGVWLLGGFLVGIMIMI